MQPKTPTDETNNSRKHRAKTITVAAVRLIADALILALWVGVLAMLFLSAGWPRWGFYSLLFITVTGYVYLTPPWVRTNGG